MISSLYIHIPFCAHICAYCDFSKVLYDENWAFSYIEELKKEVCSYSLQKNQLKTIYIGGGTPTCLKKELLKELLSFLSPYLKADGEFTIEGNPEDITDELLAILKEGGINRISLGMESSSKKYLTLMGRKHSYQDVKNAVELIKKRGFENISVDLIYALPGEKLSVLKEDIAAMLALNIPHLSAYSLTINPGTSFYNKGFKEMDDSLEADMYDLLLSSFRKAGYERYEVSNFAKPSFYSRHNLTYWHDDEYYGCGLGASGYVNGIRYTNTRSLSVYLKGKYRAEEEKLSVESQLEDFFLTNLRLKTGFTKKSFEMRFGYSFFTKFSTPFLKLQKDGLIQENSDSIFVSDKGMLLLDRVLVELFGKI